MLAWTRVMAVEAALTSHILCLNICYRQSDGNSLVDWMKDVKERSEARPQALRMSKTKTGDWGKSTFTWKNWELTVGRVKYEMSINIQVETFCGQTDRTELQEGGWA